MRRLIPGLAALLVVAAVLCVLPFILSDYNVSLAAQVGIFFIAVLGLNILTGYTGLLSLGTGGFMGVGAYACLKLTTFFPHVNIIVWILASGFLSAAVGVLSGLP